MAVVSKRNPFRRWPFALRTSLSRRVRGGSLDEGVLKVRCGLYIPTYS